MIILKVSCYGWEVRDGVPTIFECPECGGRWAHVRWMPYSIQRKVQKARVAHPFDCVIFDDYTTRSGAHWCYPVKDAPLAGNAVPLPPHETVVFGKFQLISREAYDDLARVWSFPSVMVSFRSDDPVFHEALVVGEPLSIGGLRTVRPEMFRSRICSNCHRRFIEQNKRYEQGHLIGADWPDDRPLPFDEYCEGVQITRVAEGQKGKVRFFNHTFELDQKITAIVRGNFLILKNDGWSWEAPELFYVTSPDHPETIKGLIYPRRRIVFTHPWPQKDVVD